MKRWRKRLIRNISRFFPGGAPFIVPVLLGWVKARVETLRRRRGLVRGMMLAWPYSGRALVSAVDVARPAAGEVLVRIVASAVSPGTERAFFKRSPNAETKFPFFPGYSASGEIVEVGRRVRRFRPGDKVALATGHMSVALASESEVATVPPEVTFEDAAFIQLSMIALHGIEKAAIRPGECVVVLGHGIIGQLTVQLCAALGAYPVISVARTSRRLSEPLSRATQRVIILEDEGVATVETLDADVTIEATGHPDGVPLAMRCTRPSGRIVVVGSTRGITAQTDIGMLADKSITVIGAHITSLAPAAWSLQAQIVLNLLAQGRIEIASLITERVHPFEAEWFYRRLSRSEDATVGAVFSWDRLTSAERLRAVSVFAPPDMTPLRRGRMRPALKLGRRVRDQKGAAYG